jgi:hypothetical protein
MLSASIIIKCGLVSLLIKHISNIRGSLSSPSVLGHSKSATRNMPCSEDITASSGEQNLHSPEK